MLILLMLAANCLAQDAEWPNWYSNAPARKIVFPSLPEIPVENLDLLATTLNDVSVSKYYDFAAWKEILTYYPKPDVTLVFGIRYLGTNAPISMRIVTVVFPFETVCCSRPDGVVQRRKIPPLTRLSGNIPMPTPVKLGDRFYYPFYWKTVEDWFGPMRQEGRYLVWWEKQGRRSNTLIFLGQTHGPELIK